MALASALHYPWTIYTGLIFPCLVHFLHLIFIYQLLVHAVIFIILSLCFPMALLSIPISHPLPAALSRSAILHDMSEDAFEQCTPVMGLSPARRESGKKSVKQRPRRRRRASERYEHAEAQIRGRRKDFHLQITSPRGSERYTDSSDSSSTDETHWIQAKRRAQVQFRRSRRRRRNSHKPCGNADASCAPNGMALVDVQPEGKKQQELTECESCSLKLCRGKGTRYQECSLSLPTGAFEMKRASRQREEGKYQPRDLQPSHRLGHYETIQKRLSEADSSTDILAGAEGGKYADAAGFQVNNSVQKPPATYHDGSDNLRICRSVTVEKGLGPSTCISARCELGVRLTPALETQHLFILLLV